MNTRSPILISARFDADAAVLSSSGLTVLIKEMHRQGVSVSEMFEGTGIAPSQFHDFSHLISKRQRLKVYENVSHLAKTRKVGLMTGMQQNVDDFGIYGKALATSKNLGEALDISFKYLRQAGAVLEMSFRVEKGVGILRSHDPESFGELLPFIAEFWRSSYFTLVSSILKAPLPCKRMLLPYAPPPHWREYQEMFRCPVEFNAGTMEWHLDVGIRSMPLPDANPDAAVINKQLCDQLFAIDTNQSALSSAICAVLIDKPGRFAAAIEVARQIGMSERTLHRRLSSEGLSYQSVVDYTRRNVAIEYLERTSYPVEYIAEKVGFSDSSNFRKAFRRWTGQAPSDLRHNIVKPDSWETSEQIRI